MLVEEAVDELLFSFLKRREWPGCRTGERRLRAAIELASRLRLEALCVVRNRQEPCLLSLPWMQACSVVETASGLVENDYSFLTSLE